MSKEELLELTGDVIEKLPNAMFRVRLENGVEILAHTAGKMRKFRIRVMVGDKVDIEMTPYDLTKGRHYFPPQRLNKTPDTGFYFAVRNFIQQNRPAEATKTKRTAYPDFSLCNLSSVRRISSTARLPDKSACRAQRPKPA